MAKSVLPDNVRASVARSRWRAELTRFHAATYRESSGPAASELEKLATAKEAEADLHDEIAAAEERLGHAKAYAHAHPKDPVANAAYDEAAESIIAFRRYWRGIREATGNGSPVATIDNFGEPSDKELGV